MGEKSVTYIFGEYTCHQWNGSSVVDYLITRSSDFKKIRNFSVGEFSPWLSDHCPIFTELDIRSPIAENPKNEKTTKKNPGFIWNENNVEEFKTNLTSETTKTQLDSLLSKNLDPINLAKSIKDILISTAKKCNVKEKKVCKENINPPWFDSECTKIKNHVRQLGNKLKKDSGNPLIRTELFDQKRALQKMVRQKKRNYKQSIIDNMKNDEENDKNTFWDYFNKLDDKKKSNLTCASSSSFYNHFKATFNSKRPLKMPEDSNEIGKLDHPFTPDELKKGRGILKKGKATGLDNLSNEMLGCFTDSYPQLTLKLFNDILNSNQAIPDWTVAMITPIHKKGSKEDPDNYRGISLLSCLGKLFMALLNNRLLKFSIENGIISPNQLGFLPGNRTSDAHLIIHNIIQNKCHQQNSKIFGCFVDFSKAFDTIPRDKLLEKLLKYDIKGNFFNIIKNIYCNDKACIKINNMEITDTFEINQGVKQGCILSPLLFNIYMADLSKILDQVLHERYPDAEYPSCILWADDIIMMSEDEVVFQNMLKALEVYCTENELTLNTEKTKCMIFNKGGRLIRKSFSFNGNQLETVRRYKYLGFVVTPSGELNTGLTDLKDRSAKAFFKLKSSLGDAFNRNVTLTLKLIDILVKPILLYASDFWGCLNTPKNNPISNCQQMMLKSILGVHKTTTNIGVLLELGQVPIMFYGIKASIKNWERIKSKQVNPLLYNSYSYAITNNLQWTSNIKSTLDLNGMSNFYINAYDDKPPFIHKKLFLRLCDQFHQNCFSEINNGKSKLRTYALIKLKPGLESYLNDITNPQIRKSYSRFRLSNHNLNIEKGRHLKSADETEKLQNRLCPFCKNEVESEIHFLLECPTFSKIRANFLNPIIHLNPPFSNYPVEDKFIHLLSPEFSPLTAKYIFKCLEVRNFLMEKHKMQY